MYPSCQAFVSGMARSSRCDSTNEVSLGGLHVAALTISLGGLHVAALVSLGALDVTALTM